MRCFGMTSNRRRRSRDAEPLLINYAINARATAYSHPATRGCARFCARTHVYTGCTGIRREKLAS